MKLLIKPLEWTETKVDGHPTFTAVHGCISIYECADQTWRVYFEHGHATESRDTKIRNLPDKDSALREANKWWQEWILQWLEVNDAYVKALKEAARFRILRTPSPRDSI